MIYVEMAGRLGNQMFRYAYARKLLEINPKEELYLGFNNVYKVGKAEEGWINSLKEFNVCNYIEYKDSKPFIMKYGSGPQKFCYILHKAINLTKRINLSITQKLELKFSGFFIRNNYYVMNLGYFDFPVNFRKDIPLYIDGCFESSKYFNDIHEILIKEFKPRKKLIKENIKLLDVLKSNNSICISIRRGDFLTNGNCKNYNVCSREYFGKALEIIISKVDNPILYVCSDEIEWVKHNMKFKIKNVYYESGHDNLYEKIALMTSCKHFILSNSTFSWWIQFLGSKEGITISPSKWSNDGLKNDLIEKEWITI